MPTIGETASIKGNSWQTSDLWQAAHLQNLGFRIAETKQSNGRVIFIFAESPELIVNVQRFLNREDPGRMLDFKARLNDLRDRAEEIMRIGDKKNGN